MKVKGIEFVEFDDNNLKHVEDYFVWDTDWETEEFLRDKKMQPRPNLYTKKSRRSTKRF